MGVHGLWKLIEPSGQIVPLESLAGKILAVDVSIWLHQALKGMHDTQGAPVPVAHLLILFHRLCKLLFYKIKPVFVFDGGVPVLKRQTMAARRQQSSVAKSEAMKVREKLIKNLLKHEAVRQVLSSETASEVLGLNSFALPGPSLEEELYKLPPMAANYASSESSENPSSNEDEVEKYAEDIHSVDVTSKEFLSLAPEVRHEILTELIDTRKQSSWKYLDAMPKQSDNFSDFQMNRLLKRRAVQKSLEKAGKEMGGKALSLKELESLLGNQGILDLQKNLPSKRIAKDSVTHYLLVNKSSSQQIEGKNFDIVEHLEDVSWSSESDTDLILEKKIEKQCADNKDEKKEFVSENRILNIEEPQKVAKMPPRRPNVRITKEIANILSVLEDEDAEAEIKTKLEGLQNKIVLIESEKFKKKNVVYREDKTKVSSNLLKESDDKYVIENEGEAKNNVSEKLTSVFSVEKEKNDSICVQVKEQLSRELNIQADENDQNEFDLVQSCEVGNFKAESFVAPEPKLEFPEEKTKIFDVEKHEGISDSSDVEDDFVVVSEKAKEEFSPPNFEDSKSNNFLLVATDTSDSHAKDDIFADVFELIPNQKSGDDKFSKELVKDTDKEIEDSAINKHKVEFEKQNTNEEVDVLQKSLEEEQMELLREHGKQERHALNPTDQMYSDAQELLKLFGIPYVVAPMEAEAQCATLNLIGLTEGTITDDSDIWLFGGKVVYKNFFNQNKHVLEYTSDHIQKYFKLSREEMIKMALLVGSDYTMGLTGVGPVTALEILANFQSQSKNLLDGLEKFRDWFNGKNKSGPSRISLKKKIRNIVISSGFPNKAVAEAYLNPQVDDSKEPFSWGKPNLELIKKYVKSKLGWSPEKCNEFLAPVLKKMQENVNQLTMDKYFRIVQKTSLSKGSMSKRVENAVKRLGVDVLEGSEDGYESKPKKKIKKTKAKDSSETSFSFDNLSGKSEIPKKENEKSTSTVNTSLAEVHKIKLINQRLHQDVRVPQKEMSRKLLKEKKKQAIEIFRTYRKGKKKKIKVYAKEAKLSESSSTSECD